MCLSAREFYFTFIVNFLSLWCSFLPQLVLNELVPRPEFWNCLGRWDRTGRAGAKTLGVRGMVLAASREASDTVRRQLWEG